MAKQRTVFICQQCGYEAPKWLGKCPECGEWNSFVETTISAKRAKGIAQSARLAAKPQRLSEIKSVKKDRIPTGIEEFDRVLGGGIVSGSVILVAGEPGIGKSTLMLQLAQKVGGSASGRTGLYVSGEESLQQIKIRAERLGVKTTSLLFLAETDVDAIVSAIEPTSCAVIIDSIQTLTTQDLSGTAGSISQVYECANRLLRMAKSANVAVFLIGHVTKAGTIAGPKFLEHMVDTVLYLEGERFGQARLLRTTKNRFGPTDEVGVFEMTDRGMTAVDNPSKLFLSQRVAKSPGSVVVATIEGTRPVLVEIQALVVPTQLAIPRRVAQGVDYNRLQLMTAILSKKLGLSLSTFDVYVNVAGGLRIEEPAADLGIGLAIFSSFKNLPLDPKTAVFGELGLLGELRQVSQTRQRVKEAQRLGFTKIISPENYSSINQAAKALTSLIHKT